MYSVERVDTLCHITYLSQKPESEPVFGDGGGAIVFLLDG